MPNNPYLTQINRVECGNLPILVGGVHFELYLVTVKQNDLLRRKIATLCPASGLFL